MSRKATKKQEIHPVIAAHRALAESRQARKAGDTKRAIRLCKQLLQRHPDYVAALHEIGIAYMSVREYESALTSFVRATMLNPEDWTTLASLAQCYIQLDALEMAARTMEQAKAINNEDSEIHFTLAAIYEKQREYEKAVHSFRHALEKNPDHAAASNMLGSCLVHLGDLNEAAKAYLQSHKADPNVLAPIAASAVLPADVSLIDVEKAMKEVKTDNLLDKKDNEAREAFAEASMRHKQGDHKAAWEQLMIANRLINKKLGPQIERRKMYRNQLSALKEQAFTSITPAKADPDLPVSLFILGVSRSGKTTSERLIGDLDGVKRGYENPIVELAVKRTSQKAGLLTIGSILELPRELGKEFTKHYVAELKRRAEGTRVFTNTHPGRIGDVGLLAQLVPNSKFLFVIRNREDTALRILMKQYQDGTNAYAYSVKDTLEEVDWYHAMIRGWNKLLPEHSMIAQFEDLVENPKHLGTVMKDLCGLETGIDIELEMPDDRGCANPYLEHFKV